MSASPVQRRMSRIVNIFAVTTYRDVHLQRVVLVDFSKAVETEEFLPSEPVEERERGVVLTRQPSWQQQISSARWVVETDPIKTARQTSMKLKRMTSTSSTSQRLDGLNEEHLLPVQRMTVGGWTSGRDGGSTGRADSHNLQQAALRSDFLLWSARRSRTSDENRFGQFCPGVWYGKDPWRKF